MAHSGPAAYDGGCTGGSCGAKVTVCGDQSCRAADQQTDSFFVAGDRAPRTALTASVPAPVAMDDAAREPGFFKRFYSGKGRTYRLGGAAGGAAAGWLIGGPIGALIGCLVGAAGGFFLSKRLAKK
jgi:hypothetical protein